MFILGCTQAASASDWTQTQSMDWAQLLVPRATQMCWDSPERLYSTQLQLQEYSLKAEIAVTK